MGDIHICGIKTYRRLCDDEIEEFRKLSRGSELILADTCALYRPDAVSNAIGNSKGLVICDFVEHELRSLDGKYSKKFLKEAKQSREHLLIFLRTRFKTKRESMESLNTLPADVKHLVIKVYRQSKGLEKESRHRDFALISEAFLLTQAGVNCGILSLDRCVEKTLYELSNFGYGIEFYKALGSARREGPKTLRNPRGYACGSGRTIHHIFKSGPYKYPPNKEKPQVPSKEQNYGGKQRIIGGDEVGQTQKNRS